MHFTFDMKRIYYLLIFAILSITSFIACSENNDDGYTPVSPVVVDLTQVPYSKLSDYKFFEGDMKNQVPSLGVLPYEPASSLFTDYALKKRFVWMPKGVKATFNGSNNVIELPVGAALIKTFYYNNVQDITPMGATRIIETRVMIRKANGWIFAEYIWNAEQTEAFLNMNGSSTSITWKDENDVIKTVSNYRIPSAEECLICHKVDVNQGSGIVSAAIPIGIKPQNLNFSYNYGTVSKNQLTKWIDEGYLENAIPSNFESTINYKDASQPLEKRVRSYLDINCAHCHQDGGNAAYVTQLRLSFNETVNPTKMGVCVSALTAIPGFPRGKLVNPGNITGSYIYFSMNTDLSFNRMPRLGRTIVHQEGIQLVEQWINSLPACE